MINMKIKLFENFNKVDQILIEIDRKADYDKYQHPQINIEDSNYYRDFITYLCNIADHKRIDALGGTESKSGMRRYDISDKVDFSEIIHMAPTGIAAGIKVVKYPISRWTFWDQWEGGYIEGFIRMDSDDPRFGEYFIWTYIKPEKLREILEKFGDKLKLF
jgi:hypothetical protein